MGITMREHVERLGRHGCYVVTSEGKHVALSGAFYDAAISLCEKYNINCLGYDMKIPEAEEMKMIAIWRNGHVDSGSAEHIRAVMDQ